MSFLPSPSKADNLCDDKTTHSPLPRLSNASALTPSMLGSFKSTSHFKNSEPPRFSGNRVAWPEF